MISDRRQSEYTNTCVHLCWYYHDSCIVGESNYLLNLAGHSFEAPRVRDPNLMTEQEKIAEMGKPRLGDQTRVTIVIRESADFKVR